MHPAACQLGGHGGQGEPGGKPRRRIEVDVDMVPGPADRLALVEGARLLVEAMEVRHLAAIFAATPDVVVSNLLRPPGEAAEPAGDVLSRLATASQFGWDKAQGGDLAYIPSGGLFTVAVWAWLASAIHAFTGASLGPQAAAAQRDPGRPGTVHARRQPRPD